MPAPFEDPDAAFPAERLCPRRLLAAARHLAAGLPESMAAGLAGLPTPALRRLRGDPDFDELLDDCRAFEALPKAESDAVLQRLTRAAVVQALADARVGAIPAAMRLLGIAPARPSPGGDDDLDAAPVGMPAVMRDVRVDEEGEFVAADGLPVMPGRPLGVARAAAGPVRVLDIDPAAVAPAFLDGLDALDRAQVHAFNTAAYPSGGGPQWDPVTRTLWCWGEPAEGPPRTDEGAAVAADGRDELDEAPPTAARTLPAVAVPAPAEPDDDDDASLEARVRRLIEDAAGPGPDDADLAEAVCAVCWPKWPAYAGPLDLNAVRRALRGRRVDERALARLGATGRARPPPPPALWHAPPQPPAGPIPPAL